MSKPKYYKDLTTVLVKEIAKEIGSSFEEVYSIVNTQSKFAAHIVETSGFEAVSLPYLGKFLVNPRRLQHINQNRANKNIIKYESVPRRKVQSDSNSGD